MGTTDGTVERLVLVAGDGQIGTRYNIVLIAEGYLEEDRGTFEADAVLIANDMLATAPFGDLKNAINIFRLDVWSKERGADRYSNTVETYFDARFDTQTERLLLVDTELVATTVAQAFEEDRGAQAHAHKMVVVVNTDIYGGSGGLGAGVAVASRALGALTLLHELGHLFGLLDEYDTPGPEVIMNPPPALPAPEIVVAPNLSTSFKLVDLPWADLVAKDTPLPTDGHPVADTTIGAFSVDEDGSTNYRPQWQCRMRHTMTSTFCAVCARHITQSLQNVL